MITSRPTRRFCILARLAFLILCLGAIPAVISQPARKIEAAPDDPKGDIVELPRYVVSDMRELPPPESWRYSTLPGFEILSNARDFTTRAFLKDFQMLQSAIGVVWPTLTIHKSDTPTIIILCARGSAFGQFIPEGEDTDIFITPTSLFVEDKERGAIVIDFTAQEIFEAGMEVLVDGIGAASQGDPEGSYGSSGGEGGMTISQMAVNDPYGQFYRQYSRFLMRRANGNKPIPEWLEEGLSQLFNTLDFRKNVIEFGNAGHGFGESDAAPRVEAVWPPPEPPPVASSINIDSIMRGPTTGTDRRTRFGYIMPLDAMFNPDAASDDPYLRVQWKKQCFAFAHMCLYGMNKKYQKAFLTFARKACVGPVTEDDFKQCFKKNYKQMTVLLASHVDSVSQQYVQFKVKRGMSGLPEPLPVVVREATQAEIGRIKGEVLRLAGHNDASREELIVPYLRKEHDAGLLASLGLLEALENRTDRARKFLEAAVKENVVRPRAYTELARIRLESALAAPAGSNGRLSVAQTKSMLELLFKAKEQPPPMEEVYTLIGTTWLCSEATPKEAHIDVMLEGALRFPKNVTIVEQAATLYTLYGNKAAALSLINTGLKIAPDQSTREKFETLRVKIQ